METYNQESFLKWKIQQKELYYDNIASLRWEIDFKADLWQNLLKIETWLNAEDSYGDSYGNDVILLENRSPK